jgi:hypothetical protein
MDGFKNTTKTCYSMGGYAKGGPKGAAKISKVMGEFKSGMLHSGSKKGPEVTNPKQAVAIALSEARKAGAKIPVKKAMGGALTPAERDMSREAEAVREITTQIARKAAAQKPAPKRAVPPTSREPMIKRPDPRLIEEPTRPLMRAKGGSVHKKADGGMASSIRPAKDYNASDKDFVGARASQLSKMVGKAEGGMADIKQDKAMVKAAVHKHERAMHPGKPLTKLRKGGMAC